MSIFRRRFGSFGLAAATAGALALFGAATFAPSARADDEGEEGGDAQGTEKKIKEQMDKIVRLMRENEKAILAASQGSGKRPEGANVETPPSDGSSTATPKPSNPNSEGSDGSPAGRGDEIKKKMEELLRTTQDGGGSIPKELE